MLDEIPKFKIQIPGWQADLKEASQPLWELRQCPCNVYTQPPEGTTVMGPTVSTERWSTHPLTGGLVLMLSWKSREASGLSLPLKDLQTQGFCL